ncbi:hypothetical protein ABR157_003314 [Enterobacter soli]|jgi:hypothetical protein|uniref:hypothetical protein n=1 Tax=Enterobacter soli TaxID=885040 RepID=UPI00242D98A4|nr:hypothetical protein [Enterobacter soli]
MKKRNGRRGTGKSSSKTPGGNKIHEEESFPPGSDFTPLCEKVIQQAEGAENLTADYYLCKAVIAREAKSFQTERQAVLNLIKFTGTQVTPLIKSVLEQKELFEFSEKIGELLSLTKKDTTHDVYLAIIRAFILSGSKQQFTTYFNCLMGISASFNKELPIFDISQFKNIQLLTFYEETHRILLDNSHQPHTLEKLTQFVSRQASEETSQSLLFFESYFTIDRNPRRGIDIARQFLDAPNLSDQGTSYLNALAINTARAAVKMADIEEAERWIERIKDDVEATKLRRSITKLEEKIEARIEHPLNPEHINPTAFETIPTRLLMILCAFVDGCGDDWGFRTLNRGGKYIFPSDTITLELFQTLALNGLIKMSPTSFNSLDDAALNEFSEILWTAKFHLNIIGIADSRPMALPVLLEELDRRDDKIEAAWQVRKLITTGYFYNSFEYYLGNVDDNWAREFVLNEATTKQITSSMLSGRDLSYIAWSSIRFAAGQHSIGSTNGNRHTCNTLIGSINRTFGWVTEGRYSNNGFERGKRQPVLSSETLLEKIAGFTPDDIYNLPPVPEEIGDDKEMEEV